MERDREGNGMEEEEGKEWEEREKEKGEWKLGGASLALWGLNTPN